MMREQLVMRNGVVKTESKHAADIAAERGWQPIDTAPVNVSVLIYIPNADHYGEGIYRAIHVDSRPELREAYWTTTGLHCGRDCQSQQPTHWMPLPDPPEVNS